MTALRVNRDLHLHINKICIELTISAPSPALVKTRSGAYGLFNGHPGPQVLLMIAMMECMIEYSNTKYRPPRVYGRGNGALDLGHGPVNHHVVA